MAFIPISQYPNMVGDSGNKNYYSVPAVSNGTVAYSKYDYSYTQGGKLDLGVPGYKTGPLVGYDDVVGRDIIFIISPSESATPSGSVLPLLNGEIIVKAIDGRNGSLMWTTTIDLRNGLPQFALGPTSNCNVTGTGITIDPDEYFITDGLAWVTNPEVTCCLTSRGVHIAFLYKTIGHNGSINTWTYSSDESVVVPAGINGASRMWYGWEVKLRLAAIEVYIDGTYEINESVIRTDNYSVSGNTFISSWYGYQNAEGPFITATYTGDSVPYGYSQVLDRIHEANPFQEIYGIYLSTDVIVTGVTHANTYTTNVNEYVLHGTGGINGFYGRGQYGFLNKNRLVVIDDCVYLILRGYSLGDERILLYKSSGYKYELIKSIDAFDFTHVQCSYNGNIVGFITDPDRPSDDGFGGGDLALLKTDGEWANESLYNTWLFDTLWGGFSTQYKISSNDNIITVTALKDNDGYTYDGDEFTKINPHVVIHMSGDAPSSIDEFSSEDLMGSYGVVEYYDKVSPISSSKYFRFTTKDGDPPERKYALSSVSGGSISESWSKTIPLHREITAHSDSVLYLYKDDSNTYLDRWSNVSDGETLVESGPNITHLGKNYIYYIASGVLIAYGTEPLPEFNAIDNYPADNAVDVPVDTLVAVMFDDVLDQETVDYLSSLVLYKVSDSSIVPYDIAMYDTELNALWFQPWFLEYNTEYEVEANSGLESEEMASLTNSPYVFSFTTINDALPTPPNWTPPSFPTGTKSSNGAGKQGNYYGVMHYSKVRASNYE